MKQWETLWADVHLHPQGWIEALQIKIGKTISNVILIPRDLFQVEEKTPPHEDLTELHQDCGPWPLGGEQFLDDERIAEVVRDTTQFNQSSASRA